VITPVLFPLTAEGIRVIATELGERHSEDFIKLAESDPLVANTWPLIHIALQVGCNSVARGHFLAKRALIATAEERARNLQHFLRTGEVLSGPDWYGLLRTLMASVPSSSTLH